jgi:hypothetical protein
MPSCFNAACSASSDSILFSFLMFSTMLLKRHRVAELLAALDHQHLVDGVDDDGGRHFGKGCPQRGVAIGPQVGILLAQRRDLARFELGLGDDLAVHLHQDLLDDVHLPFDSRGSGGAKTTLAQGKRQHCNCGKSVLHSNL